MKRRLNILCLVVMLVLSYSVLEQGYYNLSGSQDGGADRTGAGKERE